MKRRAAADGVLWACWTLFAIAGPVAAGQAGDEIRLIVRGDDFGYTHSSNVAMEEAFAAGFMTSASVLVPAPWFAETAAMAREHPEWSVGVHLTITSEWNRLRWGPIAAAAAVPSLLAPDGRFWGFGYFRPPPSNRPSDGSPWTLAKPDPQEVETEFRAQIREALRAGVRLDYVDCHMGMACQEELLPITERLAREYCLAISSPGRNGATRFAPDYPAANDDTGVRQALLDALAGLQPGLHLYVGHPAVRTPELLAVDSSSGEYWYRRRGAVLKAWTDPEVLAMVRQKGIELVSMREFVPQGCSSR